MPSEKAAPFLNGPDWITQPYTNQPPQYIWYVVIDTSQLRLIPVFGGRMITKNVEVLVRRGEEIY